MILKNRFNFQETGMDQILVNSCRLVEANESLGYVRTNVWALRAYLLFTRERT